MVVGIGEALWDMLPEGKKIGGAPANFAYHVSQFGLESCAVSAVGDDELGAELLRCFKERQLRCEMPKVPFPTGTVRVTMSGAGIPKYEIKEGAAWDNIPFTPQLAQIAERTRAVCFGSLAQRNAVSRETVNRFLDAMPATDKTWRIFDINLRQHFYTEQIIRDSLHKCDVLKINDEELEMTSSLFGLSGTDVEKRCHALMERFALKMLILTCGAECSYVFSGEEKSFIPTPKVRAVDTVGAGDSFTASFTAAILKGKSVGEAHRLAVETAAFVCTQQGAMPVLPQRLKRMLD